MTPVDLLVTNMAAEAILLIHILYTFTQALVGLELGIECMAQCAL